MTRAIMPLQDKPTRQAYTTNLQNEPTWQAYRTSLQDKSTEQDYKTRLQDKSTEQAYKTRLQDKPTEQAYKTRLQDKCTEQAYRTSLQNKATGQAYSCGALMAIKPLTGQPYKNARVDVGGHRIPRAVTRQQGRPCGSSFVWAWPSHKHLTPLSDLASN